MIWFNFIMLVSEGLAVLQTNRVEAPIFPPGYAENFLAGESLLFAVSLILLAWVFRETLKFVDPIYVEDLAESKIIAGIPDAIDASLNRQAEIRQRLIAQMAGEEENGY